MKKSALANVIKVIDELLCNNDYSFLKCSKNKPSSFFKAIKEGLLFTYPSRDSSGGKTMMKSIQQTKRESSSR